MILRMQRLVNTQECRKWMLPVIYNHTVALREAWGVINSLFDTKGRPFREKLKQCVECFVYCMVRQEVSNNSKNLFMFQNQGGNTKLKVFLKSKLCAFWYLSKVIFNHKHMKFADMLIFTKEIWIISVLYNDSDFCGKIWQSRHHELNLNYFLI